MADILATLSSNYVTVGANPHIAGSKYVAVDPDTYQGQWTGKYADNKAFTISISDVSGFRAKVRYESGGTIKYQDVLIKDNAFRVGDSKFTLQRAGLAQIKTVVTNPSTGASVLDTAYARQG